MDFIVSQDCAVCTWFYGKDSGGSLWNAQGSRRFRSLINARFAKPLDEEALREAARSHRLIVTLEENVVNGGFGEHITRFYNAQGEPVTVLIIAIPGCICGAWECGYLTK